MKRFLVLIVLFGSSSLIAQSSYSEEIEAYWAKTDAEFKDPEKSPLEAEDRGKFEGIERFPTEIKYRVNAGFKRTPREKPFKMKTSTDRVPKYVKYGEVEFVIESDTLKLNVYQSMDLMKSPEFKDHLFIPFTDETNGDETYMGGRYLDVQAPEGDSAFIVLDFNKAYNPYCVYNHRYSCPIPPAENALKVKIEAGAKLPGDH